MLHVQFLRCFRRAKSRSKATCSRMPPDIVLRRSFTQSNPTEFGTHMPLPTSSAKLIGVKVSKLQKQRAAAIAQAFYGVDFCFRTLSISELMPLPTSSAKRIIRTSKYNEGTQQRQSISLRMIEQITKRTYDANDSTNQAMGFVRKPTLD